MILGLQVVLPDFLWRYFLTILLVYLTTLLVVAALVVVPLLVLVFIISEFPVLSNLGLVSSGWYYSDIVVMVSLEIAILYVVRKRGDFGPAIGILLSLFLSSFGLLLLPQAQLGTGAAAVKAPSIIEILVTMFALFSACSLVLFSDKIPSRGIRSLALATFAFIIGYFLQSRSVLVLSTTSGAVSALVLFIVVFQRRRIGDGLNFPYASTYLSCVTPMLGSILVCSYFSLDGILSGTVWLLTLLFVDNVGLGRIITRHTGAKRS